MKSNQFGQVLVANAKTVEKSHSSIESAVFRSIRQVNAYDHVSLPTNMLPTGHQLLANTLALIITKTVGQLLADSHPTVSWLLADCWLTVGQLLADCWPTISFGNKHRLQLICLSTPLGDKLTDKSVEDEFSPTLCLNTGFIPKWDIRLWQTKFLSQPCNSSQMDNSSLI